MYEFDTYKTANGEDAILDWFTSLGEKSKTDKEARILANKIDLCLRLVRENGTRIGMPITRYMGDKIWELRPNDERIFYGYWKDNTFILLHHFHKKGDKTPPLELDRAKRYLKDWLERNGENG